MLVTAAPRALSPRSHGHRNRTHTGTGSCLSQHQAPSSSIKLSAAHAAKDFAQPRALRALRAVVVVRGKRAKACHTCHVSLDGCREAWEPGAGLGSSPSDTLNGPRPLSHGNRPTGRPTGRTGRTKRKQKQRTGTVAHPSTHVAPPHRAEARTGTVQEHEPPDCLPARATPQQCSRALDPSIPRALERPKRS